MGMRLASADASGNIRIWSLARDSKAPLREIAANPPVVHFCFDPSGIWLAATCGPEKNVHLWDLSGPRDADPVILRHLGSRSFHPVAFDPSGQWIVEGYMDEIAFWPLARPDRYVLKGLFGSFSPDGQSLVASSRSSKDIRILNLHGEPTQYLWTAPSGIVDVDVDPSGQFAAVGTEQNGAFLVSMADGHARQLSEELPATLVGPVRFSPQGRLIAGIRLLVGAGEEIRVWDMESDTVRVLESSVAKSYSPLKFSADGSLFSADIEGNIKRWNLQDGRSTVVAKGTLPIVHGLAVSRDARFVFAEFASAMVANQTSTRNELTLIDLQGQISRSITTHGNKVLDIALDPAGTVLVTGDRDGVIRAGPITGEEPHLLLGEPKAAIVEVSPDGRWIESYANDTTTYLWRMPAGRPFHTLPHDELLDRLRAMTNLRVVPDKASISGYRLDTAPFPGWEKVPAR
jgi:WD40 repeat protein